MQSQGRIGISALLVPCTRKELPTTGCTGQRRQSASSRAHCTVGAEFDLSSPEKTPQLMAAVVNLLLKGKLDAKTAHAICHIADTWPRAYELGTGKSQLDRIERRLESISKRPVDPVAET